jgi:hypothetical protein
MEECKETIIHEDEQSKVTNEVNKKKTKRDIFHFVGDKPMALNFEHVTSMDLEGKKINFQFGSYMRHVELENEEAAQNVFKAILNLWAGDV